MKHTLRWGGLLITSIALLPLCAGTAKAQTIYIDPVSATSSGGDVSSPSLTIDGSGLSSAIPTGTPVTGTFASVDNNSANMWINNSFGLSPTITFDLGTAYSVSGVHVWNGNDTAFGGPEAPTSATILYSTNNGASYTSLGSFSLLDGTGSSGYTGQDISLGSLTGVTDVQFAISGNYNGFASETGLSEVRFEGMTTAAAPEPSTWAMMLGGLGLLFVVLKRRQNQVG